MLYSPAAVAVAGMAFWLVLRIIAPLEVVSPMDTGALSYIFICYAAFLGGCALCYGSRIKKGERVGIAKQWEGQLPARLFWGSCGIGLLGITAPQVSTPWVGAPGSYTGQCASTGGANYLSITPNGAAPQLHPSPLASWGLHLVDVNIAMGNLINIVAVESGAYHPAG